MSAVWIAMIVALAGLVSTWMTLQINARQRHVEKAEDWARQDVVAQRVEDAARHLVSSNAEIAIKADETRRELGGQLRVIHTLVNSQLTEALDLALAAKVAALIATKALAVANQRAGVSAKEETDSIKLMESEIAELRVKLADRKIAQTQVDEGKVA
jgi:hypothetical protein